MYILYAALGYFCLGLVALLDKFILSKKISHPLTYAFYISLPFLLLFFCFPFVAHWPANWWDWIAVVGAGIFFFLGLWLMFIGVQKSEVSHVGPLVGAVIPISSLIISFYLFGDLPSCQAISGIALLSLGSLLIAFEQSRAHHGIHFGMFWGILAGLAFSWSHVASKIVYLDLGFTSGLILSRSVLGLCALLVLFFAFVRREVFSKHKNNQHNNRLVVFFNLSLSIVGVLLVQYAISLGNVAIVNAFEGLKYAVLIILVALFSKFIPKILKEEYSKGEMAQEIVAVLLIGIGLMLLI